MRRFIALLIAITSVSSAASLSIAPVASAQQATQRVTASEYRSAHDAWRIEGLDRRGVRIYFGFDGKQVSKSGGKSERSYLGPDDEHFVIVKFRTKGKPVTWRVIGMRILAKKNCVTSDEYSELYGEAVGLTDVALAWETAGKTVYKTEGDGETTYPDQDVTYPLCLSGGHITVSYTHNSDSTEWFTPALGVFVRADTEG